MMAAQMNKKKQGKKQTKGGKGKRPKSAGKQKPF